MKTATTEIELLKEATKVRQVLEVRAPELEFFHRFPVGTCGFSTELLGQWLTMLGIVGLENVYGVDQHGCTHAWLEREGLIIDITADQFSTDMPKVFVSRDRSFHNRFAVNSRHQHIDNPILRKAFEVVASAMESGSTIDSLTQALKG